MRPARHLALAAACAAALLAAPAPARAGGGDADEPLEHGKLSVCDATPIGEGALELALAWTPTWTRPGPPGLDGPEHGVTQPVVLAVGYGFSEDVDAAISISAATVQQELHGLAPSGGASGPLRGEGLGDTSVALRWRFLSEAGLDLAVVGGVTAPTGAAAREDRLGLTQGYWSAQASLAASFDAGPFTGNLEVGRGLPVSGPAGGEAGAWYGGAGLGWQIARWLQPTLEATWQRTLADGAPDAECLALTAGAILPLGDALGVSLGLQRAVWGRNTVQHTAFTLAVKTSF